MAHMLNDRVKKMMKTTYSAGRNREIDGDGHLIGKIGG